MQELSVTELNALKWVNFVEHMKSWLENAAESDYTKDQIVAKVLGKIEVLEGIYEC